MSAESLKELLLDELRDIYHAENQLVKALPEIAEATVNENLKSAITDHLEQTRGHVARLERAFEILGEKAKGKTCQAMKGLLKEGSEAIDDDDASAKRDAHIIGAAQRVEHYEIAAYGAARALAEVLGENEVAQLLQQNLDEEGAADRKLTEISESVNQEALEEAA